MVKLSHVNSIHCKIMICILKREEILLKGPCELNSIGRDNA